MGVGSRLEDVFDSFVVQTQRAWDVLACPEMQGVGQWEKQGRASFSKVVLGGAGL
jgi:hypothetical protein